MLFLESSLMICSFEKASIQIKMWVQIKM